MTGKNQNRHVTASSSILPGWNVSLEPYRPLRGLGSMSILHQCCCALCFFASGLTFGEDSPKARPSCNLWRQFGALVSSLGRWCALLSAGCLPTYSTKTYSYTVLTYDAGK